MTKLRLALDAMGGDDAPKIVIKGADIAKAKNPDIDVVLSEMRLRSRPS